MPEPTDRSGIDRDEIAKGLESNNKITRQKAIELRRERDLRIGLNTLCQKLDRILSADPRLIVTDTTGHIASTELKTNRSHVRLNHGEIGQWAVRGSKRDRLALTLALNLHELGHVNFTPRLTKTEIRAVGYERLMAMNLVEDARQEWLMTLRYPKARDYFRLINVRALRRGLAQRGSGSPSSDMFLLYYGRRHLFPRSVNNSLRNAFEQMYPDPSDLMTVTSAIDEFITLELPKQIVRGWELVDILMRYLGTPQQSGLCSGLPEEGTPSIGKREQDDLRERVVKSVERQQKRDETADERESKAAKKSEQAEDDDDESESGESGESTDTDESGSDGDSGSDSGLDDGSEAESTDDGDSDTGKDSGTGASHSGESKQDVTLGDSLTQVLDEVEDKAMDNLEADLDAKTDGLDSASHASDDISNSLTGMEVLALPGELAHDAGMLSRLFKDINLDMGLQDFRNLRRGRLDTRRVATCIAQNSDRMFKRRQADLSKNAAMGVHVTFDVSGSMTGKAERAMDAACTIAKAADMAGHRSRISTFDTNCVNIKGWQQARYHGTVEGGGGTNPLPILREARGDFRRLAITEHISNHILIIVTDGGFDDPQACERAIAELIQDGVYVVVVGIATPSATIRGVFASITIQSVSQLAETMRDTLKLLATTIHRDTRLKLGMS